MADEVIIFVTCPASEAEKLATTLVQEQYVACVNVIPKVTSIYRWEGKVCKDDETLLVIKSSKKIWNAVEARIRELHTYDVPEIICIPIELGHKPYLDWLNCQLRETALTTGSSGKET